MGIQTRSLPFSRNSSASPSSRRNVDSLSIASLERRAIRRYEIRERANGTTSSLELHRGLLNSFAGCSSPYAFYATTFV